MLVNLVNVQQVDPPMDSTESSEPGEPAEHRRPMVDSYTRRIAGASMDDPCVSSPRILRDLTQRGPPRCPLRTAATIVHVIGGLGQFRATRFNVSRWVLVVNRLDLLPFPLEPQRGEWGGQYRYSRRPESDDEWITWWAPDLHRPDPSEPMGPLSEEVGDLTRYPAREDADCFPGIEMEEDDLESTRSDVEMMGEEGALE